MEGTGNPDLIIPPGVSPHHYSMRPSEAKALADADIVFWIGSDLSPGFANSVRNLAGDALSVPLMEAPGVMLLEYGDEDTEEHGDGHAEHEADHEDEAHAHGHGHEHHGAEDPHIWLDPVNAKAMVAAIAARLAEIDPAHAEAYTENAAAAAAELDSLLTTIEAILAPVRDRHFVVTHDAFGYFEHRFGIEAAGSIALGDASKPSPSRLAEIRETIRNRDVACVFIEAEHGSKLALTAIEGTGARLGTIDQFGAEFEDGPQAYPATMERLARDIADCLSGHPA